MYGWAVRIASVSDLHVDFGENLKAFIELAGAIHAGGADAVVVAGDVSHVAEHIQLVLKSLKIAAPVVAYLPGNHDLWEAREGAAEDPSVDTWRRYREVLPALVRGEGCHYLPAAPLELGRVAIAGTTGWYDGSLLRPEHRAKLDPAEFEAGRIGPLQWTDAKFCAFRDPATGARMENARVARVMEEELRAQLDDLDGHPTVEAVVVATHVLGFREALGPAKGAPFDHLDAFMGSTRLGQVMRGRRKVRAAVFGHTHIGRRFEVDGIRVAGAPLGYPRERRRWPEGSLTERAIAWIEV